MAWRFQWKPQPASKAVKKWGITSCLDGTTKGQPALMGRVADGRNPRIIEYPLDGIEVWLRGRNGLVWTSGIPGRLIRIGATEMGLRQSRIEGVYYYHSRRSGVWRSRKRSLASEAKERTMLSLCAIAQMFALTFFWELHDIQPMDGSFVFIILVGSWI